MYNRANAVYNEGEFEEAIGLYEKALGEGFENPRIEYNLGNAYLKKNPPELGKAILHYERAKRLDPRDRDIKFNLNYANALIQGKLPAVERNFLQRSWDKLMRNVSPGEALAALSFFYFILTTTLIIYVLSGSPRVKRLLTAAGCVTALLMFFQAPIAWGSAKAASENRAVVMENELPALSGPGENNKELFKLYEGMVIRRIDCRGGWCNISIPGNLDGWIPEGKAEKL